MRPVGTGGLTPKGGTTRAPQRVGMTESAGEEPGRASGRIPPRSSAATRSPAPMGAGLALTGASGLPHRGYAQSCPGGRVPVQIGNGWCKCPGHGRTEKWTPFAFAAGCSCCPKDIEVWWVPLKKVEHDTTYGYKLAYRVKMASIGFGRPRSPCTLRFLERSSHLPEWLTAKGVKEGTWNDMVPHFSEYYAPFSGFRDRMQKFTDGEPLCGDPMTAVLWDRPTFYKGEEPVRFLSSKKVVIIEDPRGKEKTIEQGVWVCGGSRACDPYCIRQYVRIEFRNSSSGTPEIYPHGVSVEPRALFEPSPGRRSGLKEIDDAIANQQ